MTREKQLSGEQSGNKQLSITIGYKDHEKLEAITINEIVQYGVQKRYINRITGIAVSKIVEFLETLEGNNPSIIQYDKILEYLTIEGYHRWTKTQLRISLPSDVYDKMIKLTVQIIKDTNKVITPNEVGAYIIHSAVEAEMPDDKLDRIYKDRLNGVNKQAFILSNMVKPILEHDDIIDGIVLFNEKRDKVAIRKTI